MLPGFRFLFAATVLSISMLIFGLGAAALLRAAHEEFASIPLRRAPPETFFAQPNDAARPTLAMLRVEPPAVEPKAQDDVPVAAPTVEQPMIAPTPAEFDNFAVAPDKIAALDIVSPPENLLPSEMPSSEASAPEIPAQAETPAQTDALSPIVETTVAAVAEMTPPEQASAAVDDRTGIAQTTIATIGGPPVTIAPEALPKKSAAKSKRSIVKKKLQARRAKERRRVAVRARIVQQAPADPFAQPFGR